MQIAEQETTINIQRSGARAYICTSDPYMRRRLDKRAAECEAWKKESEEKREEKIIFSTYSCPKEFILFRRRRVRISDENREKARQRFLRMREEKKKNQEGEA